MSKPHCLFLVLSLTILSLIHAESVSRVASDPKNVLSITHMPRQNILPTEKAQIEDFIVENAKHLNHAAIENNEADWKVLVKDQVAFVLYLQEKVAELAAFKYDLTFTSCGIGNPSNLKLLGTVKKEGNILSPYITRFYRYDVLINSLFNELLPKVQISQDNSSALILLVHPEVTHRNALELQEKIEGIKSTDLSYDFLTVCEHCHSSIYLQDYAYYHNLVDHLSGTIFPSEKNTSTAENRSSVFIGWSDAGFYFSSPQEYVDRQDLSFLENRSSYHCASSIDNSLYFDSFLSLPIITQDIKTLLGSRKTYGGCFTDEDYGEKCIEAVEKYFTDRVKLYSEMEEFGIPLNYSFNSILRFPKGTTALNRIIIENKNLSSFLIYDEDLDLDVTFFPKKVAEIKELGKYICRRSYEEVDETLKFSNHDFCLSVLILGYELEAMFEDRSAEIEINLSLGPDSNTWIFGALVDNLIINHNHDQLVFDSMKNEAINFMTLKYKKDVLRMTGVLLGLIGLICLYGYIQSYCKRKDGYEPVSKEI